MGKYNTREKIMYLDCGGQVELREELREESTI